MSAAERAGPGRAAAPAAQASRVKTRVEKYFAVTVYINSVCSGVWQRRSQLLTSFYCDKYKNKTIES